MPSCGAPSRRPCGSAPYPPSSRAGSGSVYLVGAFGGLVLGSALGGLIARNWGITAPFWFAAAGSAVFLILIWGQLPRIAHAEVPVPA